MKKISGFLIVFIMILGTLNAQDVTTVEAINSDISENLDLKVVASLFGEAKNLEDFEKKLNDPKTKISNLDLNKDGEVDYLRVIETAKDDTHLVVIQAVIGENQYQDVATIDVEKDSKGEVRVQVIGNVYLYGINYIIMPVYVRRPAIIIWFWSTLYDPWYSPYYWGYYPSYFISWSPYPTYIYQTNIIVYINTKNTYNYTPSRKSRVAVELHQKLKQNDYETKNPDQSFDKRNIGIENKHELNSKTAPSDRSTGTPVQKDWEPSQREKRDDAKVSPTEKPKSRETTTPTRSKSSSGTKSKSRKR